MTREAQAKLLIATSSKEQKEKDNEWPKHLLASNGRLICYRVKKRSPYTFFGNTEKINSQSKKMENRLKIFLK